MSDEGITKYGVQVDSEKEKKAAESEKSETKKPSHCPICNEKLDDGGSCPNHGTQPFE